MKFRCERDVLADALATAGRAAGGRTGSPSLSGLRLTLTEDQLEVTGTDLDLSIRVSVAVSGIEPGRVVVPGKLAAEVVRSLRAGAVDVQAEGDQIHISSGSSEFSLQLIPSEDFPQVGEPEGDSVTVAGVELAASLRQVVAAASTDESRQILTGVLFAAEGSGLRLVSTDSFRLAVRDLPGTNVLAEGQSVLVPSRALVELERLLDEEHTVDLVLGERDASFSVDSVRLTTRLIEGEFPSYRNLIPSSLPNRVVASREAFVDALKRVRLLAPPETTAIRLIFGSDALILKAQTMDKGEASETIEAKYEGAELTVAFNHRYLLDGLEACEGAEVSLETVDAMKPALLRSTESQDFLYLLMPVRVP